MTAHHPSPVHKKPKKKKSPKLLFLPKPAESPEKKKAVKSFIPETLSRTKLTREVIEDFCQLVSKGLPFDGCCDYLGIPSSSFWKWKRLGEQYLNSGGGTEAREEDKLYGMFVSALKRAHACWRLRVTRRAGSKGNSMWIRDVTLLERRDRKNFSRADGPGGGDESFDPDETFL